MTEHDTPLPQQRSPFGRLRLYYLLALSAIAMSMVAGQLLVQHHLHQQEDDARLINMAGRQRMLGQQIAKLALELQVRRDRAGRGEVLDQLHSARAEWQSAQEALSRAGGVLTESAPHFTTIMQASGMLCAELERQLTVDYAVLEPSVTEILQHEGPFLAAMERTVQRFETQAAGKVTRLRRIEYWLLAIALTIIALEIALIFIPTTRRISETLVRLIKSERDAQQMSKEIGALYGSLEASYKRISAISIPVSTPKLVARADRGGSVTDVLPVLGKVLGPTVLGMQGSTIAAWVGIEGEAGEDFMDELIETVSDGKNWSRELVIKDGEGTNRYVDTHIIPIYAEDGQVAHLDIMMADLTMKRQAEQGIYRKDRAEIERKINEQKFRSVLVLEGQEEERKRIAMNIHDGIGQLLTSLKFQLAAINIARPQEAEQKLAEIDQVVKEVIQEVRRVTFNLNPPVLSDYGLAAGLKTLVQEIDRISGARITFANETGFNERMASKVENNVFRIVQEALNNAVKYAASAQIDVVLKHDEAQLAVTVQDFGVGFEKRDTHTLNADIGHGFLNMHERAAYINGDLDIQSTKGKGTIVRLFVPLTQNPIG
ncbi:histidine kinase [Parapedobacter sp. DT-150]|uniref:sensor histidine kinase n=1 Tax=Parapedobacter sp. DT-150 TaxID=3396162 RepID=UPI003F1B5DB9